MRIPTRPLFTGAAAILCGASALAQFTMNPTTYPVGTEPDATAAGDFDKDGDLDLAVTNDAPDRVSFFFNNGNGVFGPPLHVLVGAGSSPHTPIAGDLDGDGDIDVAVSLQNANAVRLLVNNLGTFVPGASFTVGADPRDLEIADLDNDFDNDLVVSNRTSGSVSVLRNLGGLSFAGVNYSIGIDPRELALGDVTGDGLVDIAVAAHDSEAVFVLRNTGSAAFTIFATLTTSPRKPSGVTMGRFDANATLDLAAAASNNGVEFAVVFMNGGGGAFGPPFPYFSGGQNANSIVAADLDLDGDLDLATANQDSNDVSMLPNTGAGAFGPFQLAGVKGEPGQILAADLDGNGAPDLVTTNSVAGTFTAFMNQAGGFTPMHSMCSPGMNGVNGCPCGNPSGRMGRGCENSAGTGGAQLSATGAASLGGDTLQFITNGERATALSVLLQGTTTLPAGVVYGQGRRCVGGVLDRLYTKNASAGSIAVPSPGDPSVSTRSAALGSPISAGQSRFYLVFYRDPFVLGGCTLASGFNATQGGRVIWTP